MLDPLHVGDDGDPFQRVRYSMPTLKSVHTALRVDPGEIGSRFVIQPDFVMLLQRIDDSRRQRWLLWDQIFRLWLRPAKI
jgi:hypothetical protein